MNYINQTLDTSILEECDKRNLKFVKRYTRNQQTWVDYICKDHYEKGISSTSFKNLHNSKKCCPYCSGKKMTPDDFRKKIQNINSTVDVIGDYVNANTPVKCSCNVCGNIWMANVRSLLNGSGCKLCGRKRISLKKKKTHDTFVSQMLNINPNITILSQYKSDNETVKCKCLIDKTIWEARATNLLSGNTGCPTCGILSRRTKQSLTQSEYVSRVKKIQPNVDVLGQYINSETPVLLKCIVHNKEFYQLPPDTYNGRHGCTKCVCSWGEKAVSDYLDEIKETYIPQYEFDDCMNIKQLKFDFYLPSKHICIEYQGEQHYKPVCFGGISLEQAQQNYEENVQRDNIKRDYCSRNGIKLIEIPFWDKARIKEIISNNLT